MRTFFVPFLTYYIIVRFVPCDGKAAASSRGCLAMPKEGDDCESPIDHWYYSRTEGKCMNFMYGDCPESGNNFDTEQECTDACKNAGAGQPAGKPDGGPVKGHAGRPRPSRPRGSSEENDGGSSRRPGRHDAGAGHHKGPGSRPGKGHRRRPRPPRPRGSSEEDDGGNSRRPVRKGSEEDDTKTGRVPPRRPGGNRRPYRPSRPHNPRPPMLKPPRPTVPKHERPTGGTKHRPRPPLPHPGKGSCGARLKRGNCEENADMWFNDGDFMTCSRVPAGRCPTLGSFFESCEDCMKKCRPHQRRQCEFKT
nr:basic salivary proline-rich protein 4-like [Dermacentor andersoni]